MGRQPRAAGFSFSLSQARHKAAWYCGRATSTIKQVPVREPAPYREPPGQPATCPGGFSLATAGPRVRINPAMRPGNTHRVRTGGTGRRNRSHVGLSRKTHLATLSGMDRMPLPPESFFEGTPPHVRTYIEQLHATIAELHMRIAELESKQAKNSTNSSLPPSSEHPHAKPVRTAPKSQRRCGGQPGHSK